MSIRAPRGTSDILPERVKLHHFIEERAREVFERYGYGEIRTPVFEETRLFVRSIGEVTDIVEKEMYTFQRGDEGTSLTLRPEGTAGIVRAYIEHNYPKRKRFQKFYYLGPMFRYERPQAGRSRQFDQFGVEVFGSDDPLTDVETIVLACAFFDAVGLAGYTVKINSMGCATCRAAFRDVLVDALRPRAAELCEVCRERLERNVFRVLDCKKPKCREVCAELPVLSDHLDEGCAGHFAAVRAGLEAVGREYVHDAQLVRGFDYYTRTVYEIVHGGIGARDAVCGGGRYDNLVEELGGPSTPAVGFAVGVVPTLLAVEKSMTDELRSTLTDFDAPVPVDVYVVAVDDATRRYAFRVLERLRKAGIAADGDFEGRSLKAQMRSANRMKARFVAAVGPDEEAQGNVSVKTMADGTTTALPLDDVVTHIQGN
ncbi:MAG TPA: histidine--tRNA ligase [Planctomycetota bacterium]|nr:histidine--tRNA ligase [Planctomycetota bacterium]